MSRFMDFNFIDDRGPAKYFHGRKEIIDTFTGLLRFYQANNRGTTFLIQGAPGAGKTALLDVLLTQARDGEWVAKKIRVRDLHDPASMIRALGHSYVARRHSSTTGDGRVVQHARGKEYTGHPTVEDVIAEHLEKRGLILWLDEAQHLGNLSSLPDAKALATSTLDVIHNGGFGRPVMLIAAGLGTTERELKSLGISRFVRTCPVYLGGLDKASEVSVIRDWLTLEGSAQDETKMWVDSIAEQTHGWPQHIISYIAPAVEYLKSNHGVMTNEGLRFALKEGGVARTKYYQSRVKGIEKRKRQALARIFAGVEIGIYMERDNILDGLKEDFTQKEADKLFNDLLERGVIDERIDGDYGIPIPSFHTWLIEEYGED